MLFDKMFKAGGDDGFYMLVRQVIIDLVSLPARCDKIVRLQCLKLVGDRRLCHIEQFRYRGNAHLAFIKSEHYSDPCRITEDLEKISQVLQQFFRRQFMI